MKRSDLDPPLREDFDELNDFQKGLVRLAYGERIKSETGAIIIIPPDVDDW